MRRGRSQCVSMALALVVAFQIANAAAIGVDDEWRLQEEARAQTASTASLILFLGDDCLAISSARGGWTYLWDLAPGAASMPANVPQIGRALCVTSDLTTLASCTSAGILTLWRADSLEKIAELTTIEQTRFPRADFSPDGQTLAVTNRWDEIELWDVAAHARTGNLVGHHASMFEIAFSPDGRSVASAGGTGGPMDDPSCIKIWDPAAGAVTAVLPTVDLFDNHAIAFSADGARLFSGGPEGFAAWSAETWERVYTSPRPYGGNWGMDVSPDGRVLAVAHWGGTVRLLDPVTLRSYRELAVGTAADVAFSPDGSRLAACFDDGTVIVWRAP